MTIDLDRSLADLPATVDHGPITYFGPLVEEDRTIFRLYAPSAKRPELIIKDREPIELDRARDGFWTAAPPDCGPGTRYRFRAGGLTFPDLASRRQDGGSRGWSVVEPHMRPARRRTPIRPWHEAIICEVHIGTVTPEGTFAALAERLEHFRDAGYTAIEIMPVNQFPGTRNWGYDGTLVFAPAEAYGTPADLRGLVDRAHELNLCVILDVVYNHFGEVDNFVEEYAPEWFDPEVHTPWGPGVAVSNPMVRRFYYENAHMWLAEYDFDGLRFDSVHEIRGDGRNRFLGELAEVCRRAKPRPMLVIENTENSFRWLERNARNQPMTYLAQWNDDMHHVLDFLITGDGRKTGYDDPQKDPIANLQKALEDGFVHDHSEAEDGSGLAALLPPDSFITFLQNHDQIGNRSDLTRVVDRASPEAYDFASFVKFLAPQIPLCFMGDEASLRSSFPFFVDLEGEPAKAKRDRRYVEMREMFNEPDVADGDLPDPADPETFAMAKLPWDALEAEAHQAALARFRELIGYRRKIVWPLAATPCTGTRSVRQGCGLIVTWQFEAGTLTMALNPEVQPADLACKIDGDPVTVGTCSQDGEVLRLGPWSAVAWVTR